MKKYIWKVLVEKSSIQVKVKYMKIGIIIADFHVFGGKIYTDDQFENPEIKFFIAADSVDTQDREINEKICSQRFLAVNEYPQISFSANNGCVTSPGGIREITGNLSLKSVTQRLTMLVNYSDLRKEHRGHTSIFNLFGTINFEDFREAFNDTANLEDQLLINVTLHLQRSIQD
jgi:polyisoprenoid-binding protein YceI